MTRKRTRRTLRPVRPILPGDTYRSPARRFHRIAIVTGAGAWSLFIMGRRVNDWGFLVDGHKVPWQQYLAERGPQP